MLPGRGNHGAGQVKLYLHKCACDDPVHFSTGSSLVESKRNVRKNRYETQYFYDTSGYVNRETDPRGVETTFTHDEVGNVLTETVAWTNADGIVEDLVTTHEYDANGNRIKTTDPLGAVRITEYNEADQLIAEIDPLGRRTEYEFDNRGNQVLVRHPDGTTETSEYGPEGNLIAETDRAGRTTWMIYDAADRLIEIVLPDNTPADDSDNPRRYSIYDAAGRLVEEVDERGNSTHYEHDAAGRNTKVIDALGNETVYEYDSRGQRTAMIDARGNRTEYEYDAAGRQVKTIHPDGTESGVTYDALGQKTAETDPAGKTTHFEYDETGNLTAVINALDQRTEYAYDERGNRVSQMDANGHTTTWTFDAAGRMLSRTLPEGQTETYGYDVAGNRTAHTDFNGQAVTYAFDTLNRPVRSDYHDGSIVETRYTASGQVSEIEVTCTSAPCTVDGKDLGNTPHSYDMRDRLTRIDYPDGRWIEYAYDEAGNRTEVRTENQHTQYTFDPLNRMRTVLNCADAGCTQGEETTYFYNAVGSRSGVLHTNGAATEYEYDGLNRLTGLTTRNAFGQVIHGQAFTLGAAGHRERLAEDSGRVVEYTYDALYRLVEEKVTDPRGDRTNTDTFDATGNRTRRTVTCDPECHGEVEAGVTTYTYDDNDRLTSETGPAGTTTYQYDANGNTTQKVTPGGTVDYDYNADNRLTRATGNLDSGALEATYAYDAHGIRQRQTVDGLTTRFLVDPTHKHAQVLEELDDSGEPTALYVIGHERISQQRAEGHYTYHADGLGSVRALTDLSGTETDSYVYEAYGNLEHTQGNTPNNFRYTGEQYDPNLGFYYLRARYYDPATGRFPTMDTYQGRIHEPQTLHKYLYVHGNPVNGVDPSGNISLTQFTIGAGIATVLTNTAVSSYTVGRIISSGGKPDGISVSLRVGGAKVIGIGGGADLVYDFKSGEFWGFGAVEAIIAPLTGFRPQPKFVSSVTAGLAWNMRSPRQFAGAGVTSTWPIGTAHLLARAARISTESKGGFWGFMTQTANFAKNRRSWSLQFGFSGLNGPAFARIGPGTSFSSEPFGLSAGRKISDESGSSLLSRIKSIMKSTGSSNSPEALEQAIMRIEALR